LILRKIRGFDATRCQIFKAKMHKIRFPLGICPRPRWGTYSAPPDPVAAFKGPTCKRREGEEGPRYFGLELPLILKPYAGHYALCYLCAGGCEAGQCSSGQSETRVGQEDSWQEERVTDHLILSCQLTWHYVLTWN